MITGVITKCRNMIGTVGLPVLRDDIVRMISLRKVKGLPDRMSELSHELRSSASNESHFLDMGRTLQSLYADTTELIKYIQDTIQEVMGDANDNILNKAGELAKQAETALTHHQERVALSLVEIKDVADHLGGLNQACDYLGRIAMNLRVVGLNIGVESTRSEEGREMFTVVSKEIIQLSEKVDGIVNRIREDATAAMTEQIQAFDTISSGLQELNGLTAEASGVTSAAANETEKGIADFLKAFETADVRFREISSRVGEIVMNIQFHDNMRQRVEHITNALDKSGRVLRGRYPDRESARLETGEKEPGQGDSRKEALGHACSIVALQKIQLADVITEINRVYRESTTAFEEIGREIGELDGIMSTVNAGIYGIGADNKETLSDPFSKLATALTGLNGLLGRGDELGGQIEESVSRASEIGRRFSVHLRDVNAISFETKIKALNAIVKAGHMSDEGRTLDVLAQEMNRLSDQSNGFVAGVEEKLRRIGEFGDRVRKLGKDVQEEHGQHSPEILEILAGGIEEISRMKDLMNERVDKAMGKVEALEEVVGRTLSDLKFLTILSDDMSEHLEALDDINNRLSPLAEKWKAGEAAGPDTLSESYTMQRERMIHAAVLSTSNRSIEETRPDFDNTGLIEMEEDVSLWGEDAPEATLPDEGDVSLWGDDAGEDSMISREKGNLSLWGEDENEAEKASPGKRDIPSREDSGDEADMAPLERSDDDEAFGENVELF